MGDTLLCLSGMFTAGFPGANKEKVRGRGTLLGLISCKYRRFVFIYTAVSQTKLT